MRVVIAVSLGFVFALLSACTTEEGIEKHKEKGSREGSMLNKEVVTSVPTETAQDKPMKHKRKGMKKSSKSGKGDMIWEASVYERPAAPAEVVGMFAKRGECGRMAMKYIEKKGYTNALYSCGR